MSRELQHEEPTRGKEFSRMARSKRRQYGSGCLLKRGRGWAIRWRELQIAPDGTLKKALRYENLGEISRGEAADILALKVGVAANSKVPTRSRVRFRTIVEDWKTSVMPMYKHSTPTESSAHRGEALGATLWGHGDLGCDASGGASLRRAPDESWLRSEDD